MELKSKRVLRQLLLVSYVNREHTCMDPHKSFCHNERCWAYGPERVKATSRIYSQKERRYGCKRCGRTLCATKGTALYRVHKPHELITTVVTLLEAEVDYGDRGLPGAPHRTGQVSKYARVLKNRRIE